MSRDYSFELPPEVPRAVPLFPLPDHVLLPACDAPYRLFEPRYRALMAHVLTLEPEQRWIAVPRLAPGWQPDYEGSPKFEAIGTVARVAHHQENADGTYNVLLRDGVRCLLEECGSEGPFRMVWPVGWPDLPDERAQPEIEAGYDALIQLVAQLASLLGPGARGLTSLASEDTTRLRKVFRLGSALIQHPDRREEFLKARMPSRRIDQLLEATAVLVGIAGSRSSGGMASS